MAVVLDRERSMTLGLAERQGNLLDAVTRFCDGALPEASVYAFLHRERDRLFPDELFADLFADRGRRSVPPSVVATVMVLQRLEGLSDREAVERYSFDARWRYAAGVGGYDTQGWGRFVHTVLVDMRERLRRSERPDRVFEVALDAAKAAGLVGRRRVLDSTPLYDAVATMDTLTLIRSALRGLLAVAEGVLAADLRAALQSGDDYASSAKPQIDWDDATAREVLVDSRATDAFACLAVLDGRALVPAVAEAAALLATVVGQDLAEGDDGRFRIARKVARDRVISTVDPQARHGHKTAARGFDGYKGHAAVDPDSEIITATQATPGNHGDASVAADLIDDLLADPPAAGQDPPSHSSDQAGQDDGPKVYGDAAYGTGELQAKLEDADIASGCKTQPPTAPGGLFAKDRFDIDLDDDTITCPAGVTVTIRRGDGGGGIAYFSQACGTCALQDQCTSAAGGRTISVGPYEEALARARRRQVDPTGRPTTELPGPRSNASSLISCAAGTVAGGPESGAQSTSTPTSGCWLPRPTSPAWPCSGWVPPPPDGRRRPHEGSPIMSATAVNSSPATSHPTRRTSPLVNRHLLAIRPRAMTPSFTPTPVQASRSTPAT